MDPILHKRFMFKNIDQRETLEEFANKELIPLERLILTEQLPHEVTFTFHGSPDHAHERVELHIVAGKLNLYAAHEGDDCFKQIKDITEKMVAELRKAKEEQKKAYKTADSYKSA